MEEESRSYHGPEYALQLQYNIRVFLLQSVLLDELCELTKMTLLMKHLTPELGLRHDSVEMRRNNPVKRAREVGWGMASADRKYCLAVDTYGISSSRSRELKLKLNARARKISISTT